MIICGIDPGAHGGIAFIHTGSGIAVAYKIPETRGDAVALFRRRIDRAYLERVRSSPQMGVTSAFTFGCNYERMAMICTCLDIPLEEITPQRWQKALGCLTGGDKNVSKARAQALFPKIAVTHATADSLLICEFGRREMMGKL